MGVRVVIEFRETNGAMKTLTRVQGNGQETSEELNRAMAMAKAANAVMKEMHGGEIVMENLNDDRVCEVMVRGYQCDSQVH
ncbi:hypothetical protein AVB85_13655 [Salmonella enterica subsp. enterica serovar Vitkin]|uniref:Uncharacterized protein n=1 Tax=Salmonella enterica subsp. enterica serovar Glostrup TaxID=1151180 RepID=A0A5I6PZH4_SALET|nr:hypothetical protein [Salmonella bongori]EBD9850930.1 hypothetical protein [Salmonella enterica]EBF9679878.1 hypothetical protein [Salmonella enterica subsp. enterica serovar Glostrup]ECB6674288.1 hypothetical protein [Salmonella enterica subsp. enterica serovar Kottbus]ECB6852723.1 hypothetical protein [Salmonella enterica subsp. enterica serovar Hvittingfoss]ECD2347056.1 hypothetical protein [Salmonella enterica subsp. enterica serovar Richmond]ECF1344170.1 hypothetical protein [Salmonel